MEGSRLGAIPKKWTVETWCQISAPAAVVVVQKKISSAEVKCVSCAYPVEGCGREAGDDAYDA